MKSFLLLASVFTILQSSIAFGQEKYKSLIINDNGNEEYLVKRDLRKHGVLVMDEGFDVRSPVFKDKIVATYTTNCEKQVDVKDVVSFLHDKKVDFETAKFNILEFLKTPDEGCVIDKKLVLNKSDKFDEIRKYKNEFNMAARSKGRIVDEKLTVDGLGELIHKVISGEGKYTYHGTYVSSLIAYQNPNVQFVFLQTKFGGANIKNEKTDQEKAFELMCNNVESYHLFMNLLEDQDFQTAFIQRPISSAELALEKIAVDHNIQFINYSFGERARVDMEKLFQGLNCPYMPNFKKYFRIKNELDRKREKYLKTEKKYMANADVLIFQSAGNDGLQVDTLEDTLTCSKPDSNFLVIGATNWKDENASSFSNHGDCVDIKTLGESVVTTGPEGFLIHQVNGTSFSSPLAIRHATTTYDVGMSSSDLKEALLSSAGADKVLDSSTYPNELAFENKDLMILGSF